MFQKSLNKRGVALAACALLGCVSVSAQQFAYYSPCDDSGPEIREASAPAAFAVATNAIQVAGTESGLATVTINVSYWDVISGTGAGFDDAGLGATRQATVSAVMTQLANTVLAGETGTLDVTFATSEADGTGFLAAAGTLYPIVNGFEPGLAWEHITTGVDPAIGFEDIQVTVDFGYTWNSDTGAPAGGEYDLYSVLLHEVTHGLGIASLTNSSGASQFFGTYGTNTFTTYDDNLYQISGGTKVWNASTQAYQLAANGLFQGLNTIEYRGSQAQIGNSGSYPVIYTPAVYAPGSSVSHFDESGAVMEFSISIGTTNRNFLDFEYGAFADLGYTTPVPVELSVFSAE